MTASEARSRLDRLAGYLEADPENPGLLLDCAQAALDDYDPSAATTYFMRSDKIEPLAGELANAAGIAAMRSGDQHAAQMWFERALGDKPGDIGLRFNIAWSRALGGDFAGAADLLESDIVEELPQAAMLDLQLAHEFGKFDEATEKMEDYLDRFPEYQPLHAVASVLAMDIDRPDLARIAAEKGGAHPDALTTLASLDLGDRNLDAARDRFEQALAAKPRNPRAEIGLGLVDLAEGNSAEATRRLDKGAEQFDDHLGSWIAAGWAHFIGGDLEQARARFETAIAHDAAFGEAQGSLAVVELLEGDVEAAARRAEVARRLDRSSFSVALAYILLEQSKGNRDRAQQIFQAAMAQPILPNGSTLMDELVKALGRS